MDLFNFKKKKNEGEKPNFWISYADIMAGLLLMFILILIIVIFDYQDVLSHKETKIEEMLGIRKDIVSALQEEFKETELNIEIDSQTGAIRFPGKVFFELDSTKISEQGSKDLAAFIPRYVNILLGKQFRKYISEIIVEGHTDDRGEYMYNLELSQERALEVVKEIFTSNYSDLKYPNELRNYLTANGRSYSQPIKEDGVINRNKSRRVEFKFRLKDEQMIKELRRVLEE